MRALAGTARAILAPPGFIAGMLSSRWRGRSLFCFFATPGMGGAERVHAQIVAAVADRKPVVMFTEVPRDTQLLPLYTPHSEPLFLHTRRRNRAREYFNEARIATEINRARDPVVFGAFSHFFYNLLPRLDDRVYCVDLIHNFGVQFEHFSIPYAPRLDERVVLSEQIRQQLAKLYESFDYPERAARQIRVIPNGVAVPEQPPLKPEGPLEVLYVGRATPEKRVHLIGAIAAEAAKRGVDARFTLVGEVEAAMPEEFRRHCRFEGVISDADTLNALYDRAHLLLLTSSREGLPMAMLEGMARGAVPLAPAVGAIPENVEPGSNGVLLDAEPEGALVSQAADAIARLAGHRGALTAMSKAAHAHVKQHCSLDAFNAAWRGVLAGGRND